MHINLTEWTSGIFIIDKCYLLLEILKYFLSVTKLNLLKLYVLIELKECPLKAGVGLNFYFGLNFYLLIIIFL